VPVVKKSPPRGSVRVRSVGWCQFSNFRFNSGGKCPVAVGGEENCPGGERSTAYVQAGMSMVEMSYTRTDRHYVLARYGHIKTTEQRTIIQQHGDWYTGR